MLECGVRGAVVRSGCRSWGPGCTAGCRPAGWETCGYLSLSDLLCVLSNADVSGIARFSGREDRVEFAVYSMGAGLA